MQNHLVHPYIEFIEMSKSCTFPYWSDTESDSVYDLFLNVDSFETSLQILNFMARIKATIEQALNVRK